RRTPCGECPTSESSAGLDWYTGSRQTSLNCSAVVCFSPGKQQKNLMAVVAHSNGNYWAAHSRCLRGTTTPVRKGGATMITEKISKERQTKTLLPLPRGMTAPRLESTVAALAFNRL